MTATASLTEIVGAVINAIGILAAMQMLAFTWQRHDAVLATGGTRGGPRIIAAWRHFRCEGSRIAYHVVSLGLICWAMTRPPPSNLYSEVVMAAQLVLSAMFTLTSVFDLRSDSRLDSLLREPPRGAS